jgi:hypothetical protein
MNVKARVTLGEVRCGSFRDVFGEHGIRRFCSSHAPCERLRGICYRIL